MQDVQITDKTAIDVKCDVSNFFSWLSLDIKRKWYQLENKNCFNSSALEAIYVYPDKIKYWEDLRVHNNFKTFYIPKHENELKSLIGLVF